MTDWTMGQRVAFCWGTDSSLLLSLSLSTQGLVLEAWEEEVSSETKLGFS